MPKVFISYSHDSIEHKDWVLKLATDLRTNGVDATLDRWDLAPGQDLSLFMQKGIADSDRVLLVCSEKYITKSELGSGGVGYERLIVTRELVESIDTKKFIPIVRNNETPKKVPSFIGPRLYIDFLDESAYGAKFDELLRELCDLPAISKPPLGTLPFSGSPKKTSEEERIVSLTGITPRGKAFLDEDWYHRESTLSSGGLLQTGYQASMELRFGLHDGIKKSQIELLDGMRKSQITTFGWPIAVMLENRDEYRPRPYGDGIRAEVAINGRAEGSRSSYDYWAARSNGDFYLRQSLFEDERAKDAIFFNTRIVRVTEALLFAHRFYLSLGVPPEARLSVRVTHRGLSGRTLSSSNSNRAIFPGKKSVEAESLAEVFPTLTELKTDLAVNVEQILAPMFMLFDFQMFSSTVYKDIVERFSEGQVT